MKKQFYFSKLGVKEKRAVSFILSLIMIISTVKSCNSVIQQH